MTQSFAVQINILAEDLAVGTGKINQLKNAVTMLDERERLQALIAFRIDDDNFTGFDIANIRSAHQIKGAGLGSDNPTTV